MRDYIDNYGDSYLIDQFGDYMNVNHLIEILTELKNKGYGEYRVFANFNLLKNDYETISIIQGYPENKCLWCADEDFKDNAEVPEDSRFFDEGLIPNSKVKGIILS